MEYDLKTKAESLPPHFCLPFRALGHYPAEKIETHNSVISTAT
jgi:hypothetical protein